MLNLIIGPVKEAFILYKEMSPYLLFGFFFAGVLHVLFSIETIARHLGKNDFSSILKAVLFGIPLPLCSCGVIPSAVTLRKSGASKPATMSFLIATPITGIDSIMATYSLLGLPFTVYRLIASCLTALVTGVVAMFSLPKDDEAVSENGKREETCPHCIEESNKKNIEMRKGKFYWLFHYAFVQSVSDIWKWLILGLLIGGIISFTIPEWLIQRYLGGGFISMIVMMAVGIPMYICSTGSIPIAASLMMKGMSPGAALVFLLAGPATNTVAITIIGKELGKKATAIYVGGIAVMSMVMGYLLNLMAEKLGVMNIAHHMHAKVLPSWLHIFSSLLLAFLILAAFIKDILRLRQRKR